MSDPRVTLVTGSLLLALQGGVLFHFLSGDTAARGGPEITETRAAASSARANGPAGPEQVRRLQQRLERLKPRGYYILIDTAAGRLYLKKGDRVLLDAVCSTGTGRRLVAGDRQWSFKTPRGEFQIMGKARNPIWRKPDWAFLEEGRPIPVNQADRYETGVLGEYALAIGNGYFIHGTLYNRLLGKNVTHGCIRLGSEDLIYLSETVPLGTKVFIY